MGNVKIVSMEISYKEHKEPFHTAHREGWKAVNAIKVEVALNKTEFIFFAAQGKNNKDQFTWAVFAEYGSIIAHTEYQDFKEHDEIFEQFVQESITALFVKNSLEIDRIKEHLAKNKRLVIGMIGLQPQTETNAADQSGQVH